MKYLSILLLFTLFGISDNAPKEKRIALLIGNGHYDDEYYTPLKNPLNDVDEMKILLEKKGFEVTKIKDADLKKMKKSINDFTRTIRKEQSRGGQRVISLFYYGGHGNYYQKENKSYLIPIKSEIEFEEQYEDEAYSVNLLLKLLYGSGNYLNIVMLDACRSNRVFKRKVAEYTKAGDPPLFVGVKSHKLDRRNDLYNLLVSYAASKDGVAESGQGKKFDTSPYVRAFKDVMNTNSREKIREFFSMVHLKTIQKSINKPDLDIQFYDAFQFDDETPPPPPPNDNFVFVEGGTFQMGSNDYDDEKPVHSVTVSSFYISKYEITNSEYAAFLTAKGNQMEGGVTWLDIKDDNCKIEKSGNRFIAKSGYANHPVIEVSWYGAKAYCDWRTKVTGKKHRLPTEAEWEYAAKGGKKSKGYKYSGSDDIDKIAWYSGNSDSKTHQVGQKLANELGLYDMSGNVWEWCQDWYDSNYYTNSPSSNPVNNIIATCRVVRGGSWNDYYYSSRVANRAVIAPTYRNGSIGFRCLRAY